MKRILLLIVASFLLLASCTPAPLVSPAPTPGVAGENDPCCLVVTDAGTIADYYTFGTNCLKVREMGDAYKAEDAPRSLSFEFGGKEYPMYYSVTVRPSGELNVLDAYRDVDSFIQLNVLHGTEEACVVSFADSTISPTLEGDLNEENIIAFAQSLLPEGFDPAHFDENLQINEGGLGAFLTYTGKIGDLPTIERAEIILDGSGALTELRIYNYKQFSDVSVEQVLDLSAIQVAVSAQIQKAYRNASETPIETVMVKSATLGKDVDGELYYTVNAEITYSGTTAAPTTLDLLYFPARLG